MVLHIMSVSFRACHRADDIFHVKVPMMPPALQCYLFKVHEISIRTAEYHIVIILIHIGMYVCMCVCIYIYIYIYTGARTHTPPSLQTLA